MKNLEGDTDEAEFGGYGVLLASAIEPRNQR